MDRESASERQELSAVAVAALVGASRRAVQYWLSGRYAPSRAYQDRLVAAGVVIEVPRRRPVKRP